MFREQLAELINKAADLRVSGETDNIAEALRIIELERPQVAIVDITLKGASGLELLKELRNRRIVLPVLVLSMHEESLYAERALRAGASGYITKHEASADVLNAIRRVLAGEIYLKPQFMSQMMSRMIGGETSSEPMAQLTDRELDVFRLIGRGLTTREIAAHLSVSNTTVETYVSRIREKLNLDNSARLRLEASRWAQQHE